MRRGGRAGGAPPRLWRRPAGRSACCSPPSSPSVRACRGLLSFPSMLAALIRLLPVAFSFVTTKYVCTLWLGCPRLGGNRSLGAAILGSCANSCFRGGVGASSCESIDASVVNCGIDCSFPCSAALAQNILVGIPGFTLWWLLICSN